MDDDDSTIYDDITISNLKSYPTAESKVICTAYVTYTSKVKSEAALRNHIQYDYTYTSNGSTIDVATYARADLNRDGEVDDLDWNAIATYMARLNKNAANADEALDFGFEGVTAPIDLAKLSADINRDGKLDDQDVIMYGKVVSGQVEL